MEVTMKALFQDVLQNNNGRRRRSLTTLQDAMEGEQLKPLGSLESLDEEQLKSLESLESLDEDQSTPLESVESLEEDKLKLSHSPESEEGEHLEVASDRNPSARRLSFFEDFFIRLPQALGLVRKVSQCHFLYSFSRIFRKLGIHNNVCLLYIFNLETFAWRLY